MTSQKELCSLLKNKSELEKLVDSNDLLHKEFNVSWLVGISPSWLQWYRTEIMGGKDPDCIGYVTLRAWYSPSSGNFYVKGIWADVDEGVDDVKFYYLTIPGNSSTILESDWAYDGGYRDIAEIVTLDMYPTGKLIRPDDCVEVYKYKLITERFTSGLKLYLAASQKSGQLEMELLMKLGAKCLAHVLA